MAEDTQPTPIKNHPLPGPAAASRRGNLPWWKRPKMILLVALAAALWLGVVQVLAADRYEATVVVVDETSRVGVNPTTEKLDFGDLSRDFSARRVVTVSNNGPIGVRVLVIKTGLIAELIEVDSANFRLKPGQSREISFSLRIPPSAPTGQLRGGVMVLKIPFL